MISKNNRLLKKGDIVVSVIPSRERMNYRVALAVVMEIGLGSIKLETAVNDGISIAFIPLKKVM